MDFSKCRTISCVAILICTLIFLFVLSKYSSLTQWSFNRQYMFNVLNPTTKSTNSEIFSSLNSSNNSAHPDLLLIYVYTNVHEYAYGNLKYFIETAVREQDGVDYIFILQETEKEKINKTQIPTLSRTNAFYYQHKSNCFDMTTVGWFLDKYTIGNPWNKDISSNHYNHTDRIFNLTRYKYFILMNSSVRGPFFPPYFLQFFADYQAKFNKPFHWYDIFTKRIDGKVKIVGPTLACEPFLHIQSYFIATDFVGLSILLKDGTDSNGRIHRGIFGCYGSKSDTFMVSDIRISTLTLEAGYMITSLMSKYQCRHFSKKDRDKCTVLGSPYIDKQIDGISLEPYDVIFVKYTDKERVMDAQGRATLYQRWMEEVKTTNRSSW